MPEFQTRTSLRLSLLGALTAAMALCASPARAQTPPPGAWSVGVLGGEALNHNLVDLVPKALQGELEFKPAHLAGVVIRQELSVPDSLAGWGRSTGKQVRTSLEVDVLKGTGLVDNTEVVIAWRPGVTPWPDQPLMVEFSWGLGVSHSFGRPWSDYTDPNKPDGHRTLLHMSPEMSFRWRDHPEWALALRVQHRSGMYGLFAPRRVGSNHLAVLLTHDF